MSEPPDPPRALRASDAERDRVVELLRTHTGDGRLTPEELDERADAAYRARTLAELEQLTADLPTVAPAPSASAPEPPAPGSPGPARRWTGAGLGGARRKGPWRPGASTVAVALMGGCRLDLREAELEHGRLTVTTVAIMGGTKVVVPEGARVELSGLSIMGGRDCHVEPAAEGAGPVIHVRAYTVMGGVEVRSQGPGRRRGSRAKRRHLGHGA